MLLQSELMWLMLTAKQDGKCIYVFSCHGNKIDKRSIDGKVFGSDIEGTLIFSLINISDDTTKYLSKKPDYISQIGKDGSYKLQW